MLSCLLNGQRINCFDGTHDKEQLKKWAKKKILICPACEKPYEYCHGKVRTPYFRHMDKIQCDYNYSEPETEEHICGKRDLYEWLKNQPGVTDCVLEGWIPETKQRPDIMFKYNNTYYLTYSANMFTSTSYAVGVATSSNPLTGFVKDASNPIMKGNNSVGGPGHVMIFKDFNGYLRASHHVQVDKNNYSGNRKMAISAIWFDNGKLTIEYNV